MDNKGSWYDGEIVESEADKTPKNTVKNTQWAMNLWNTWSQERNKTDSKNIPELEMVTSTITETEFVNLLKTFVVEVRSKTGQQYTPESLKLIGTALQRYLKEHGWPTLAVMDTSKREYHDFHEAFNARSRELYAKGIGTTKKQADTITLEHERILWDKGIFNTYTSKGLSKCVFFYTCKAFKLHTGIKQRLLKRSDFFFGSDEYGKYVQFDDQSIKALPGMKAKREHYKPDTSKHYRDKNNPRCYYNLLKKYISLIPKEYDNFYYRPGYKLDYCPSVIGKNALDTYVASMLKEAGIDGFFTNRSVRGTLACHTLMPRDDNTSKEPEMGTGETGETSSDQQIVKTYYNENGSPLLPSEVMTPMLQQVHENPLQVQEVTTFKGVESPLQIHEVSALKRKIDQSHHKELPTFKLKKLEESDNINEIRSEDNTNICEQHIKQEPRDIPDSENIHFGDFELNLGNFLPNECIIKPSDVIVKKESHENGDDIARRQMTVTGTTKHKQSREQKPLVA